MIISLQYSFVCRNLIRETIPSITVVHTDDVIDDRAGLFVVGSVYEKDKLNYSYLFSKLSFKTAGWSYVDTVSENVFEKVSVRCDYTGSQSLLTIPHRAYICLFKFNKGNTRTVCEICLRLTIKTSE